MSTDPNERISKKTIAVDFDGVIHGYRKGWHDGMIYDTPVKGAAESLKALMALGFEVVIYSTRNLDRTVNGKIQKGQAGEIFDYLQKHGIPFTRIHTEPSKPLCVCFIDDNAIHFDNWPNALGETIKHISRWL